MNEIIHPLIDLASANVDLMSKFNFWPEYTALCETILKNNLRLANECTGSMLGLMKHSQDLLKCQAETVSRRTEQLAGHVVHASVRSIAIAAQARKVKRDRRMFCVTLPGERRCPEGMDRRLCAP